MRLIDADALYGPLMAFDSKVLDIVDNAQTIDAVQVVRCGECMWYYEREGCFFSTAEITPDAFCSYGERENDEID